MGGGGGQAGELLLILLTLLLPSKHCCACVGRQPPATTVATTCVCRLHACLQGIYGSTVDDVRELRGKLKLGDVVQVEGRYCTGTAAAGRYELQATAVVVLKAWRDSRPGEAFTPRPAPRHVGVELAEEQAQQGQQQGQQRLQKEQPQQEQLQLQQRPLLPPPPQQQAQQAQQQQPATSGGSTEQQQGTCQVAAPAARERGAAVAAAAAAREAAAGTAGTGGLLPVARPHSRAQQQEQHPAMCKAFVNSRQCAKGAQCPFAHGHTGALRQRWLADR